VLVFACNTGSVHALGALREEFEPGIPVVGTVPAIKPAAAFSDLVAIWATVATTGSAYQRNLITEFAASAQVAEVACAGLADAIHAGDEAATRAAVSDAAARTPAGCRAIVLGCTEYELAAGLISAALPGVALFGSATAVAAQALRRAGAGGSGPVPGNGAVSSTSASSTSASPTSASPTSAGGAAGQGKTGPGATGPDTAGQHTIEQGTTGQGTTGQGVTRQASIGRDFGTPGGRVGTLQVLLSGRPASLPPAALRYPEGRLVAARPAGPPARRSSPVRS
jgi:glutamate racemase